MKNPSGLTFKDFLDSTLNPGDDDDDGLKIWDYVLVHGGDFHNPMEKSDLEEAKEEADDQKKLLQKSTPCVRPIRKDRRL